MINPYIYTYFAGIILFFIFFFWLMKDEISESGYSLGIICALGLGLVWPLFLLLTLSSMLVHAFDKRSRKDEK